MAIELLNAPTTPPLAITLINERPSWGLGLAYGTEDDSRLLNAPAGQMSLNADIPDDFVQYCLDAGQQITPSDFAPRRLFGAYIAQRLGQAAYRSHHTLDCLTGAAVDVGDAAVPGNREIQIHLADGRVLQTNHVILATGHEAPVLPAALCGIAPDRIISAWDNDRLHGLSSSGHLLILGTGQTAIEAALALIRTEKRRRVTLISRRGLIPRPHTPLEQPGQRGAPVTAGCGSGYPWGIDAADSVSAVLRRFRQHADMFGDQAGGAWQTLVSSLRPHIPGLWASWSVRQQRQFLRHVRPYWDIHRHRLPPKLADELALALRAQSITLCAGRLTSITSQPQGLQAEVLRRRDQQVMRLHAEALILASGPNTDLQAGQNPLIRRLQEKGYLLQDVHRLGLMVDESYRVLNACGQPARGIRYCGPLLRAQHWEATAVPELREHARRVAQGVLADVHGAMTHTATTHHPIRQSHLCSP